MGTRAALIAEALASSVAAASVAGLRSRLAASAAGVVSEGSLAHSSADALADARPERRTYRPCGYSHVYGGRAGWRRSTADRF